MISEVVHRHGDELLPWNGWEATEDARDDRTIDELARLLVHADRGDDEAEADHGLATPRTRDCVLAAR